VDCNFNHPEAYGNGKQFRNNDSIQYKTQMMHPRAQQEIERNFIKAKLWSEKDAHGIYNAGNVDEK
jgi:hypothetical protein